MGLFKQKYVKADGTSIYFDVKDVYEWGNANLSTITPFKVNLNSPIRRLYPYQRNGESFLNYSGKPILTNSTRNLQSFISEKPEWLNEDASFYDTALEVWNYIWDVFGGYSSKVHTPYFTFVQESQASTLPEKYRKPSGYKINTRFLEYPSGTLVVINETQFFQKEGGTPSVTSCVYVSTLVQRREASAEYYGIVSHFHSDAVALPHTASTPNVSGVMTKGNPHECPFFSTSTSNNPPTYTTPYIAFTPSDLTSTTPRGSVIGSFFGVCEEKDKFGRVLYSPVSSSSVFTLTPSTNILLNPINHIYEVNPVYQGPHVDFVDSTHLGFNMSPPPPSPKIRNYSHSYFLKIDPTTWEWVIYTENYRIQTNSLKLSADVNKKLISCGGLEESSSFSISKDYSNLLIGNGGRCIASKFDLPNPMSDFEVYINIGNTSADMSINVPPGSPFLELSHNYSFIDLPAFTQYRGLKFPNSADARKYVEGMCFDNPVPFYAKNPNTAWKSHLFVDLYSGVMDGTLRKHSLDILLHTTSIWDDFISTPIKINAYFRHKSTKEVFKRTITILPKSQNERVEWATFISPQHQNKSFSEVHSKSHIYLNGASTGLTITGYTYNPSESPFESYTSPFKGFFKMEMGDNMVHKHVGVNKNTTATLYTAVTGILSGFSGSTLYSHVEMSFFNSLLLTAFPGLSSLEINVDSTGPYATDYPYKIIANFAPIPANTLYPQMRDRRLSSVLRSIRSIGNYSDTLKLPGIHYVYPEEQEGDLLSLHNKTFYACTDNLNNPALWSGESTSPRMFGLLLEILPNGMWAVHYFHFSSLLLGVPQFILSQNSDNAVHPHMFGTYFPEGLHDLEGFSIKINGIYTGGGASNVFGFAPLRSTHNISSSFTPIGQTPRYFSSYIEWNLNQDPSALNAINGVYSNNVSLTLKSPSGTEYPLTFTLTLDANPFTVIFNDVTVPSFTL